LFILKRTNLTVKPQFLLHVNAKAGEKRADNSISISPRRIFLSLKNKLNRIRNLRGECDAFHLEGCIYCKKKVFFQLKFIDAQLLLVFAELKYPKGPLQILDLISEKKMGPLQLKRI